MLDQFWQIRLDRASSTKSHANAAIFCRSLCFVVEAVFQLKYSAGLESTGKIEFSLLGFVEDRLLELFAAFRHENVKHIGSF